MRYVVTISMLFFYCCASAQKTTKGVEKAVYAFNKALETKDTVALKAILDDNVSYGHSNAWIENKSDVMADLYNGTLTYNKISQPELRIDIADDIATVRGNGIFDVTYKEKQVSFDLHVMQT